MLISISRTKSEQAYRKVETSSLSTYENRAWLRSECCESAVVCVTKVASQCQHTAKQTCRRVPLSLAAPPNSMALASFRKVRNDAQFVMASPVRLNGSNAKSIIVGFIRSKETHRSIFSLIIFPFCLNSWVCVCVCGENPGFFSPLRKPRLNQQKKRRKHLWNPKGNTPNTKHIEGERGDEVFDSQSLELYLNFMLRPMSSVSDAAQKHEKLEQKLKKKKRKKQPSKSALSSTPTGRFPIVPPLEENDSRRWPISAPIAVLSRMPNHAKIIALRNLAHAESSVFSIPKCVCHKYETKNWEITLKLKPILANSYRQQNFFSFVERDHAQC